MALRQLSTIPQYTDYELDDLRRIYEEASQNRDGILVLNMANDTHYRVVNKNCANLNLTPDRYPQLFRQLDLARTVNKKDQSLGLVYDSNDDGYTDANVLLDVGLAKDGIACSDAVSTYIGGAYSVVLTLQVFKKDTMEIVAHNNIQSMGEGEYTPISAQGTAAVSGNLIAYFFIDYTKDPGTPTQHIVITKEPQGPVADPKITQPVQKPNHTAPPWPYWQYIRVGLSRGVGSRDDVDYWFNQGLWDDRTVMVPLDGNVTYSSNIKPLVPEDTIQLNMSVALKTGGMKVLPADMLNTVYPFFYVSPNDPKTLLFKKPAPTDPQSTDNGNPIVFGPAPWNADTVVYFFCQIAVKTDSSYPLFDYSGIISSDTPDSDPRDGILYIKPFQFTWHCVAQGVQIKLADGSSKVVENIVGKEMVLSNTRGEQAKVVATHVGKHRGPVLRIRTDNGCELMLSESHVVMTPQGPKPAGELHVGSEVITLEGASKTTFVRLEEYDGFLFNLELDTYEPGREGSSSMFANGILVGDFNLQTHYYHNYRKLPHVVLKRLPQEFHRDFQSLLEDIEKDV